MKSFFQASAFALAVIAMSAHAAPPAGAAKNIVLVHGSFADGSGWAGVARILQRHGYVVSIVQQPETSLAEDVKATTRILDGQAGPTVLVGHSYGGSVITEAGNHPKVASLVYVSAFQPDAGETTLGLTGTIPAATKAFRPTDDGYFYLEPSLFPADFGADLPKPLAEFMARSQVMTAGAAFTTPVTDPAWKSKPSWALVATQDRAINPELERWMAKRAHSTTIEVKGSHSTYITHPREVASLIEQAAIGAGETKAQ